MSTTVAKGRLAECYVKRLLEKQGYTYIIRSHASRTQIDLIASNGTQILAIQVKKGGYVSQVERNNLSEWALAFKAKPCLSVKHRGRWVLEEC